MLVNVSWFHRPCFFTASKMGWKVYVRDFVFYLNVGCYKIVYLSVYMWHHRRIKASINAASNQSVSHYGYYFWIVAKHVWSFADQRLFIIKLLINC